MGNSTPWGIAGECCFASTAEEWWSRRLWELSQWWAFFSDVQEMHPKAGEGGGRPQGPQARKSYAEARRRAAGGRIQPAFRRGYTPWLY